MSALVQSRPPAMRRIPRGIGTLLRTEIRIFLRDPGSVFFTLAFPVLVLLGVGFAIPGMNEIITEPGPLQGYPTVVVMLPAVLATAVATPALTAMPVVIVTYREQGVLTRLSTTPMPPAGVLGVHLAIGVSLFLVALAVALGVGASAFGFPVPGHPVATVVAIVLGSVAVFGLGLVVAARVAKGSTAQGIGMLVYFPMLFFAGLWTPGPIMPDAVAAVATWTPLGAMSQAVDEAWFTGEVPWLQFAVLAGYAVVTYAVAVRLFRWR
ncbi:ABC transporter permease [Ruania halotolerans]|uniref:ABC transporter permease n=1 Tax=Ruania halotolerans TaxID=2897773 RepID=UPI001E36DF54|nr:ABC transporter permease [Ruania halotolerans]UFU05211.1 ABC transporter permease [Ruania halotolerans]